jgi:hypothetical protein
MFSLYLVLFIYVHLSLRRKLRLSENSNKVPISRMISLDIYKTLESAGTVENALE